VRRLLLLLLLALTSALEESVERYRVLNGDGELLVDAKGRDG
jgi:hypothetical protein